MQTCFCFFVPLLPPGPWMVTFRATELMSTTVGFAVGSDVDRRVGGFTARETGRLEGE